MRDQRTKYIEHLIEQNWPNKKAFAEAINIPYTTLHSMLQRGIGNASVNNVIKVCNGLGITTDELIYWGNLYEIGSIIKEEREKRGINIEELSQKAKISLETLSQIEKNIVPITPENLKNITNVFDMTTQELLIKYEMYDEAILQYFHEDKFEHKEDEKNNNEIQTIAAHMDSDLSEEEMQEIKEYIEFIKSKRK